MLDQNDGQAASDKVDTDEADEVIDSIAKTVAELTSQQDGVIRQQVIEQLMQEIMKYDAEFRREEATSPVRSHAKQLHGASDRVEHAAATPPHAGLGRGGSISRSKGSFGGALAAEHPSQLRCY